MNESSKNRIEIISLQEMKLALDASGYILEKKMSDVFAKSNYSVVPNQIIVDPVTDIRREIDFVAMDISYDYDTRDHFGYEIICECENTIQPIVFIPSTFSKHRYISELKYCGYGEQIDYALNNKQSQYPISDIPFSTQYCSFQKTKGKEGKWIALHPGNQHDTFNKLKKAIQHRKKLFEDKVNQNNKIEGRFHFGLLVVNSDIYMLNLKNDMEFDVEMVKRVRFCITDFNEESGNYENYFIEVVNANSINEYVYDIKLEGQYLVKFIKDNRSNVMKMKKKDEVDFSITWI